MPQARGRAFWERIVREVDAGATRTQVAARHGVASSAVGYWVSKLRREQHAPRDSAALVPVRIVGEERRRIEVAIGNVRVVFEEGSDPSYVVALVRSLAAC